MRYASAVAADLDPVFVRMQAEAAAVERSVEAWLALGLQGWSPSMLGAFEALAQRAHHSRLVGIERDVVALRTIFERYLERDPDASVDRLLERLVWIGERARRVLAAGDRVAAERVVGVPRRSYAPVDGALVVVPLLLRGWRTDSDFVGATVTFAAPSLGKMVEGSVARPASAFGDDPRRMAQQWVSDAMMVSLQELAHGAWSLEGAKLSDDGRLSFPKDLVARPTAADLAAALAPVRCRGAGEVVDRLAAEWIDPIDGEKALVYLEGLRFGERRIDDTRGVAEVWATDGAGARLALACGVRGEDATRVANLAQLAGLDPAPDGLVAEARIEAGAVRLDPHTLVFHEPVEQRERRRARRDHRVHLACEPLAGLSR